MKFWLKLALISNSAILAPDDMGKIYKKNCTKILAVYFMQPQIDGFYTPKTQNRNFKKIDVLPKNN